MKKVLHYCHLSVFFCLLFILSATLPAKSSSDNSTDFSAQIKQILGSAEKKSLSIGKSNIALFESIQELYKQGGYQLYWKDKKMILSLLKAINESEQQGLSAQDYHKQAIKQRLTTKVSDYKTQRAQADILMSDAFLRLVYHKRFGKVIAKEIDQHWNLKREFIVADPIATLQQILTSAQTLNTFFTQLNDLGVLYKGLIWALAQYKEMAAKGGWETIPTGQNIKPGMQDPRLPLIAARLQSNGYLVAEKDNSYPSYNDVLQAAVKKFQASYNLDVDGIIGNGTLEQMNISAAQRVEQIKANLERVRWVKNNLADEFVLVNVAGYKVYYIRDNKVIWKSKVQVGKHYRKTPIFRDNIEYIVLNPTWTVPPTILARDILPKIKEDPAYLQKKNMAVIDAKGNNIDSTTIDWPAMTGKNFPYMIRQEPGSKNALGRVKIMFPNKHLVYLHDTPSKSLFNKTDRAFSSGCIRVERPFELVELLLKDNKQWNQNSFQSVLDSGQLKNVKLPKKVPVLLLYFTAQLDDDGNITFFKDIYKRDQKIIDALKQPFRLVIPDKKSDIKVASQKE